MWSSLRVQYVNNFPLYHGHKLLTQNPKSLSLPSRLGRKDKQGKISWCYEHCIYTTKSMTSQQAIINKGNKNGLII